MLPMEEGPPSTKITSPALRSMEICWRNEVRGPLRSAERAADEEDDEADDEDRLLECEERDEDEEVVVVVVGAGAPCGSWTPRRDEVFVCLDPSLPISVVVFDGVKMGVSVRGCYLLYNFFTGW